MTKNEMDRSGAIIIKICIFSIILSLTALLLCGLFQYFDGLKNKAIWSDEIGKIIIIDAGHGGEDGGASAPDGTKEKELNLAVAATLGKMLEASGYTVIQTRSDDIMLGDDSYSGSAKMRDLKRRIEIAEENDNAIFISIHMNKFFQAKYSGLQVFYSKNNKSSVELANMIQNNTREYLQKDNNRQSKEAGSNIFILDRISSPAVLVECGFLSNPEECSRLKDMEYQKELAAVIYASVIEFYGKM